MKTAMNYRKGWKEFVQAENRQRSTRWCGGGGVIQPDDVVEDNVFMQGLIWAWPKVSLCNFFSWAEQESRVSLSSTQFSLIESDGK